MSLSFPASAPSTAPSSTASAGPRRRLPRAVAAAALLTSTALVGTLVSAAPAQAAVERHKVKLTTWSSTAQLARGVHWGTAARNGQLVFDRAHSRGVVDGRTWEMARWASPWVTTKVPLTELIPSWQATTPGRTAIRVQVRGRTADGRTSSWDDVAFWAASDGSWKRHTYGTQSDDLASMSVDTWRSNSSAGLVSWQLRFDLLRPVGGTARPAVQRASAVSSKLSSASWFPTSTPTKARGTVLNVPRYSQMVHRGHYPAFGGGGEAWCSPTSVSMVLGYRNALPTNAQTAWAGNHADRVVDTAARGTYDHTYRGAGNWAFSTAWAGTRGRETSVTRMRSLNEVENQIARNNPVVVSVRFSRGELSGAPISSTNGHLLVVVGFTKSGDVVVNDPAAPSNATVRRTYKRAQFENVWLPASPSGSGGLAYLIL